MHHCRHALFLVSTAHPKNLSLGPIEKPRCLRSRHTLGNKTLQNLDPALLLIAQSYRLHTRVYGDIFPEQLRVTYSLSSHRYKRTNLTLFGNIAYNAGI